MSTPPRLTVGSLRRLPILSASPAQSAPRGVPPAPMRPKRCCGTGCAGCAYGAWVRRIRAAGMTLAPSESAP